MNLRGWVLSAVAGLSIAGAHVTGEPVTAEEAVPPRAAKRPRAVRRAPSTPPRRVHRTVAAPASQAAAEAAILARVNAIRKGKGLSELRADPTLARVARSHSDEMASKGYFEHTSPSGVTLADRVVRSGLRYRAIAENIARGWGRTDPVADTVEGWMKSPGHRANILRPDFVETGIGVARVGDKWYITQDFLKP